VELAEVLAKAGGLISRGSKRSILLSPMIRTIFAQVFLPSIIERVSPCRPVILLDEFDALEDVSAADSIFQFFAKLVTDYPQLAFVITLGEILQIF